MLIDLVQLLLAIRFDTGMPCNIIQANDTISATMWQYS